MYRDDREVRIERLETRVERLEAENATLRAGSFTVLDWLGTAAAVLALLALLLYPLTGSTFADMFRDLGGPLPAATRLALSPWFAPAVALALATMLMHGLMRGRTLRARRLRVLIVFVIAIVTYAALIGALYLPIFRMAGAIKAE
jgi:hypothetical protein